MSKQFPIRCTRPGSELGTIVEGYFTHNPISEGEEFETTHNGYRIRFKLDMHFYTHPDSSVIEVVSVTSLVIRPRLNESTQ